MPKPDTSFDVEQFERESRAGRKKKRTGLTPLRETLEHVKNLTERRFGDSTKMQKWIDYLLIEELGETQEEKDKRRRYKFEELWPPAYTEFNDGR